MRKVTKVVTASAGGVLPLAASISCAAAIIAANDTFSGRAWNSSALTLPKLQLASGLSNEPPSKLRFL